MIMEYVNKLLRRLPEILIVCRLSELYFDQTCKEAMRINHCQIKDDFPPDVEENTTHRQTSEELKYLEGGKKWLRMFS